MIGDNTKSDIEGANRMQRQWMQEQGRDLAELEGMKPLDKKWVSILVRTGVWKEGESTNGADYVVDGIKEAFEIVLEAVKKQEEAQKQIL